MPMALTDPVFTDCLTAQLHLAGNIQPHGGLLVLDDQQRIVGASANIAEWLDKEAAQLIEQPWQAIFPSLPLPGALKEMNHLGIAGSHLRALKLGNRDIVLAGHHWANRTLIEIEYRQKHIEGEMPDELAQSRGALLAACTSALATQSTPEQAAECLMRHIALGTGFDRVILLQFMHDWHGKVIAEALKPGIRGYLGQHFPANDIPQNARSLYVIKRQRLIADAHADPVPIILLDSETLDLTHSELRAAHPAHIQYMKNMGVAASFSVSIVVNGALWGLVVCHSLQPRSLPFAVRLLCEHMANTAALHIGGLRQLGRANARHEHSTYRARLKQDLQTRGPTDDAIHQQLERVRQAFKADGAWAYFKRTNYQSGQVPAAEAFECLRRWLQSGATAPVHGYNRIPDDLARHSELVRLASGALHIQVDDDNFIVLLRHEQPENIEWAGPPDKPDAHIPGTPLSPRRSFDAWKEQTQGQALPWEDYEYEAASELRTLLRELLDYLQLEQQSLTDPLTGLGNRQQLQNYVEKIGLNESGPETFIAVFLIDLDRFKPVNDTYGHSAGDQVLIEAGQRMSHLLRDSDLLARLGGDEFAIVLPRQKSIDALRALGERLIQAIAQPYRLDQDNTRISASIGAAVLEPGMTLEMALHNADMAMYRMKHGGGNGFALFDGGARSTHPGA